MHKSKLRAHRTPTVSTASPQGKKRKQTVRELSDDRKRERERDEVAEATILCLTLHKTALATKAQENIAKVQEKLDEEEIEKMVEGDEDEESYASEFADSMINDDVDDSGTKIEPGSHKEHLEIVNDDDDQIEKEKNNEEIKKVKKHDDDEKIDEVVMEKDDDDDVEKVDKGVKEKITEELTGNVSPTPATTSKDLSTSNRKKRPISYRKKILPGSIAGMCRHHGQICSHIKNKFITCDFFMGKIREILDHCNKVVPELTFAKTNEMINKEMPRLVNLAVNKDREVDPINAQEMIAKEFATHAPKMIEELFRKNMQYTTLNLYPTKSSSTAGKSTADLQQ
ncbi:hypothetical protein Tco_1086626 [Tanacetum coccineum]